MSKKAFSLLVLVISCSEVEIVNDDIGSTEEVELLSCSEGELATDEVGSTEESYMELLAGPSGGKFYYCFGHCGEAVGPAGNQCFCDTACVGLGDCCPDYRPFCGDQKCEDWCGMQAPFGCFCDDACSGDVNDCCPFKTFWCGPLVTENFHHLKFRGV